MITKRLIDAGHFNRKYTAIIAPPKNPAIQFGKFEQFQCAGCDAIVVRLGERSSISPDIIMQCADCKTFNRFPHEDGEVAPHIDFDGARTPHTFPAEGKCIYCGNTRNLTREHVIARRLRGDLVFLKSSCESCATITGRNEQVFLRVVLREARAHLGIGNPANRPKFLPITRKGESSSIDVPVAQHPFGFWLMVTGPPAILRGGNESDWQPFGTNCRFWKYEGPDNTRRIREYYPAGASTKISHTPDHFTLMLGKIAHSYACAKLGYWGFRHFLPDLIRTDSNRIGYFFGTHETLFEPDRAFHTLRLVREPKSDILTVEIRLFAHLGTPTYRVVVGEINSVQ